MWISRTAGKGNGAVSPLKGLSADRPLHRECRFSSTLEEQSPPAALAEANGPGASHSR
jgi:hypothetical protein